MTNFNESQISKAILSAYHDKYMACVDNDVVIVGAGPAGLTAAMKLAGRGYEVVVLEKRLAPGGGIWGGAMGLNEVVVQEEAVQVLEDAGVRRERKYEGLYVVDAVELAAALVVKAVQAGAVVLNLVTMEDVALREGRVCGVVVNRTMISGALPVDPMTLSAKAVIDATGHEAVAVNCLAKRGLVSQANSPETFGERPMNAPAGEAFVVDHVAEAYPGLWVAGMSVCTTYAGPRMGPIFGGMLLSGVRVADSVTDALGNK